jgi:hypothetical protein
MKLFELKPTNGRKSFGNKANVSVNNDIATLLSYNTPICEFNTATNDFKMVYTEKISNTTSSHIKAFKQFYNIN